MNENFKKFAIYEVKKFGTTLEWDIDVRKAESAFNNAEPGEVVMYRMEPGSSVKKAIRRK